MIEKKYKLSNQSGLELEYIVHYPAEYTGEKQWPLILFLHGACERGSNVDEVKRHGIPKVAEERELPFITISPQCPRPTFWKNQIGALKKVLDEVIGNYNIDKTRIYLTGMSMGGIGTLHMANRYPDLFAAIIPICAAFHPVKDLKKLKSTPIWLFHGMLDRVIPAENSMEIYEYLKPMNREIELTLYDDLDHDSWTRTYDNSEIYQWLLSKHT